MNKNDTCIVCSFEENNALILHCDHCYDSYHIYCAGVGDFPIGEWFCPECDLGNKNTKSRGRPPAAEIKQKLLAQNRCYTCRKQFPTRKILDEHLKSQESSIYPCLSPATIRIVSFVKQNKNRVFSQCNKTIIDRTLKEGKGDAMMELICAVDLMTQSAQTEPRQLSRPQIWKYALQMMMPADTWPEQDLKQEVEELVASANAAENMTSQRVTVDDIDIGQIKPRLALLCRVCKDEDVEQVLCLCKVRTDDDDDDDDDDAAANDNATAMLTMLKAHLLATHIQPLLSPLLEAMPETVYTTVKYPGVQVSTFGSGRIIGVGSDLHSEDDSEDVDAQDSAQTLTAALRRSSDAVGGAGHEPPKTAVHRSRHVCSQIWRHVFVIPASSELIDSHANRIACSDSDGMAEQMDKEQAVEQNATGNIPGDATLMTAAAEETKESLDDVTFYACLICRTLGEPDSKAVICRTDAGEATAEEILRDHIRKSHILPEKVKQEVSFRVSSRQRNSKELSLDEKLAIIHSNPSEFRYGFCLVCKDGKDGDNMLFCDFCDDPYHMYCLPVSLIEVPEGQWYCPHCDDNNFQSIIHQRPRLSFDEINETLERRSVCVYCRMSCKTKSFLLYHESICELNGGKVEVELLPEPVRVPPKEKAKRIRSRPAIEGTSTPAPAPEPKLKVSSKRKDLVTLSPESSSSLPSATVPSASADGLPLHTLLSGPAGAMPRSAYDISLSSSSGHASAQSSSPPALIPAISSSSSKANQSAALTKGKQQSKPNHAPPPPQRQARDRNRRYVMAEKVMAWDKKHLYFYPAIIKSMRPILPLAATKASHVSDSSVIARGGEPHRKKNNTEKKNEKKKAAVEARRVLEEAAARLAPWDVEYYLHYENFGDRYEEWVPYDHLRPEGSTGKDNEEVNGIIEAVPTRAVTEGLPSQSTRQLPLPTNHDKKKATRPKNQAAAASKRCRAEQEDVAAPPSNPSKRARKSTTKLTERAQNSDQNEGALDDEDDGDKCVICTRGIYPNAMLLCDGDGCNRGFHMYCLKPTISMVPVGSWYCPDCAPPLNACPTCGRKFKTPGALLAHRKREELCLAGLEQILALTAAAR